MPKLENWSVCSNASEFMAPELRIKHLTGIVYGHKYLKDGANVATSTLIKLDLANKVAETKNTIYDLGEINPDYKKWCEDNNIQQNDI